MPTDPNKAQMLSHEEIVKQFLGSKAVDFTALGKFVADHGASIAISGSGDYGVSIGHYNVRACYWRVNQRVSSIDVAGSGIASDVLGRQSDADEQIVHHSR